MPPCTLNAWTPSKVERKRECGFFFSCPACLIHALPSFHGEANSKAEPLEMLLIPPRCDWRRTVWPFETSGVSYGRLVLPRKDQPRWEYPQHGRIGSAPNNWMLDAGMHVVQGQLPLETQASVAINEEPSHFVSESCANFVFVSPS